MNEIRHIKRVILLKIWVMNYFMKFVKIHQNKIVHKVVQILLRLIVLYNVSWQVKSVLFQRSIKQLFPIKYRIRMINLKAYTHTKYALSDLVCTYIQLFTDEILRVLLLLTASLEWLSWWIDLDYERRLHLKGSREILNKRP